jgi:putative tricarboxylic transport membrane protein
MAFFLEFTRDRRQQMDKESRIWETIVAAIAITLSTGAWVVSAAFPKGDNAIVGPALFPRVLGVIVIISSLVVLIASWRSKTNTTPSISSINLSVDRLKLVRVIGLLGVMAFAPFLLGQFGLVATAVVLTTGVCLLLGAKWFEALIAGAVMFAFVELIFVMLLKVQT